MATKTSQLQIRVTEEQKTTLKQLARAANMSVSEYVLSLVLPARGTEVSRLLERLASGAGEANLGELAALFRGMRPSDFADALAAVPLERLAPLTRNQLAALVEQAAHAKSVEPPGWVHAVPPLARPHFRWSLESLRPHEIRVTPVPFKRRGIFFDPATYPAFQERASDHPSLSVNQGSEALRRLEILAQSLQAPELKVEFYLLGGAIVFQAFRASPPTAHVSALFGSAAAVVAELANLTRREGWDPRWLQDAIKDYLLGGVRADRYLELPSLAVFVPPLEYVLALKIASLRAGADDRAVDDLRYVVRALNLVSADAALEIAGRYFAARQLPADARATLQGLLAV